MIAVLTGSTGLVGSELLQLLLNDSNITKVISLSRQTLGIQHSKLEEVLTPDFSHLDRLNDHLVGDVYFCCLGTTIKKAKSKENFYKVDFDAVIEFAKIAKMNNAKNFIVVSASGAKKGSSIFYNKVKGEMEEALIQLGLSQTVIFRPALLIGERKEHRLFEKLAIHVVSSLVPVVPNKLGKMCATNVPLLAKVMLIEGKKKLTGVRILNPQDI